MRDGFGEGLCPITSLLPEAGLEVAMETRLSILIRTHMSRHGLSRSDFVKDLGYVNVAKGHRRLAEWLNELVSLSTDQKQRLARVLGLPAETITNAIDTDHRFRDSIRGRFSMSPVPWFKKSKSPWS